jgi:hypothetical protein
MPPPAQVQCAQQWVPDSLHKGYGKFKCVPSKGGHDRIQCAVSPSGTCEDLYPARSSTELQCRPTLAPPWGRDSGPARIKCLPSKELTDKKNCVAVGNACESTSEMRGNIKAAQQRHLASIPRPKRYRSPPKRCAFVEGQSGRKPYCMYDVATEDSKETDPRCRVRWFGPFKRCRLR